MTDLEMTKRCALAMGIYHYIPPDEPNTVALNGWDNYDPLHNDAQAMALVKKLRLHICPSDDDWSVWPKILEPDETHDTDLNRAIVECVAKLGKLETCVG